MLGILALVPALPLLGFAILFVTAGLLPRRWIEAVGVGSVGLSAILALIVTVVFLGSPQPYSEIVWNWIAVEAFTPHIGFYLDALSLVMMLVVTFVSFLIHLYSAEFMSEDEGYSRYFAYMNLFVASMLVLVLADNLLLPLSRLGRRRSVQLPADRLLVSGFSQRARRAQGVHRHPRGRHRDGDRPLHSVHQFGDARDPAADATSHRALAGGIGARRSPRRRCCSAVPSANRRNFRCRPGCPTPWPARRRSAPSSMPQPW